MAGNIYEEMEAEGVQPTTPSPIGNMYAQMEEGSTPIDTALAQRQKDVLDFQAQQQQKYMERMEALRKFEAEHPEARVGADVMREEPPLWDPSLGFNEPSLPAREKRPAIPQRPKLSGAALKMGLEPQLTTPPNAMGSGLEASFKIGLVRDPETRRRIMASTLFPNDPDAFYRVGFDAKGEPVYVGDDGKLHKIASGLEAFGANLAANSPEMLGASAGALGGPGLAGLGAASAHGVKRVIAGQIFDEPQDPWQNAKDMAIEGATAATGEGVGRLYGAVRNAGRTAVDFPAEEIARADALRRQVLTDSSGRVNLNLADASDDPFIKSIYQYGWRQPGQPSRLLREARTENDLAYQQWTNDVLDQIARAEPSEESGRRAVNAARDALTRAQTRANNIADPYYHAAWNAHPVVRDPTVLSFFNLPGFGESYEAAEQLARMERVPLRPYQPPSLQMMDFWLRSLKGRARALSENPDTATMGGAMWQRIGELDNALIGAYPELRDARTVYRTARTALVEPLENGKVGMLAAIDDPQARTAAAKIFADKDVSPEHIAETRRAIESVNPAAWAGVSRQWLASKWDDALQRTQSAEQRNAPGKMQAEVFGTPRDEEIARAMLTPAQYDSFNRLMNAARRLASTPVGGSTTPQELAIGKALEGNINSVMQLVTAARHPFKSGEDVVRKAAREQNILNLTNALLDPTQRHRMDVITRMRPGKQQAILLGAILSEESAKRFIQSEMAMGPNSKLIIGKEDAVGE